MLDFHGDITTTTLVIDWVALNQLYNWIPARVGCWKEIGPGFREVPNDPKPSTITQNLTISLLKPMVLMIPSLRNPHLMGLKPKLSET